MQEKKSQKTYFTRKEAAEFLRISVSTLDYYVRKKYIPVVKLDRRVLFDLDDLISFCERNKVKI